MNRKIKYGLRIIINYIRFPLVRLFSRGKIKSSATQLISIGAHFLSDHNGKIILTNRNQIEPGCLLHSDNGNIFLENVFINRNCTIVSMESIVIKSGVTIGPNVCIYDHDHNIHKDNSESPDFVTKPILIEDGVWIGANSTVLKGVTIHKNAVIAAGTVVVKDVPENAIVSSKAAEVIKKR